MGHLHHIIWTCQKQPLKASRRRETPFLRTERRSAYFVGTVAPVSPSGPARPHRHRRHRAFACDPERASALESSR